MRAHSLHGGVYGGCIDITYSRTCFVSTSQGRQISKYLAEVLKYVYYLDRFIGRLVLLFQQESPNQLFTGLPSVIYVLGVLHNMITADVINRIKSNQIKHVI